MKYGTIIWNADKNKQLIESRGVSFDDVESAVEQEAVLGDVPHPLEDKYPHQR